MGEIYSYALVVNGTEINVTAQAGLEPVTYTVPGLTSGTEYNIILFTVFENVRSSGVSITAATGKFSFGKDLQQEPGQSDLLLNISQTNMFGS